MCRKPTMCGCLRSVYNAIMQQKQLTLVGLGLMGGSLARRLSQQGYTIQAIDLDKAALAQAQNDGVITAGYTSLAACGPDINWIILATPVRTILSQLADLPSLFPAGCWIMDLGSTKVDICRAMEALPRTFSAIGGHPMCGKETGGYASSDASLFDGQTFVLSPNRRTSPPLRVAAQTLVGAVGARPLEMSPSDHDAIVAYTSHLPYLLSAGLVRSAAGAAQSEQNLWPVSASGFRDTSRLAGTNAAVMLDILLTNREAVLAALDAHAEELLAVRELLEACAEESLLAWLEAAKNSYLQYRREKFDD